MKYTYKEYLKYAREIKKEGLNPITFKLWKIAQPVADKVVGKANKIINKARL